ncbi:MAG TPA: hypothetical protein H9987_00940 [Candidatus Luteococcus avicola]|nr:hypothetical protein [Candidatus Luteococcus avicola]
MVKHDTSNDVLVWIQAAIPPKPNGHLDRPRAAKALGVSARRLASWVADPASMPLEARKRFLQLAILRGKGRILWPDPDPDVLAADVKLAAYAQRAVNDITDGVHLDAWNGPRADRLYPHALYVLHYPHAHVNAITIAQDKKSQARYKRAGAVVTDRRVLDHYWLAQAVKHTLLAQKLDDRCLVPASVVPIGRTHTWREAPKV